MPAVGLNASTRLMWRLHRWLFSASKGRFGARFGGHSILRLSTTGRRSGRRRTVLLSWLRDHGDYVVVASYAGADRHPSWWLNLLDDPRGAVTVDRESVPIVASAATGDRRARLWRRFVDEVDPAYQTYQDRTARLIPIVLLTPV